MASTIPMMTMTIITSGKVKPDSFAGNPGGLVGPSGARGLFGVVALLLIGVSMTRASRDSHMPAGHIRLRLPRWDPAKRPQDAGRPGERSDEGPLDLPQDRSAPVDGSVTTSSQYFSSACIVATRVEKLEGFTM